MFVFATNSSHFAVSAAMKAANCCGEFFPAGS
jgi:hypothetical protein